MWSLGFPTLSSNPPGATDNTPEIPRFLQGSKRTERMAAIASRAILRRWPNFDPDASGISINVRISPS